MNDNARNARIINPNSPSLTVSDAARYIGVSKATIIRWCDKQPTAIPHTRTLGGHRRFRITDLDEFLKESSHSRT